MDAHILLAAQQLDKMSSCLQLFEVPHGEDPVHEDLRATQYYLQDRVDHLLEKLTAHLQGSPHEHSLDEE